MIENGAGRAFGDTPLAHWQEPANLHYSFQHVAEFVPTTTISRGTGPVAELAWAPAAVSEILVPRLPNAPLEAARPTVAEVMAKTETDGWLVLHRGLLVAEEYRGETTAESLHLLMSVTKSLVATVAGSLIGAGLLDPDHEVTAYVPALATSGYAGATVRHLLDMRSGIGFSEDYLDPEAEIRLLDEAIGWAPRRHPEVAGSMYDFLAGLQQTRPHGGPFEYRSCEADVLGWVCESAGGVRMPDLMSQLLWSRIGAEHAANIALDSTGTGVFDGGASVALRDLARFGAMVLAEGTSLTGEQVVPASWIADTFDGGDDTQAAFVTSPTVTLMPGGRYRNQFWFPSADPDVALCLGIHGQLLYLNRRAQVAAAKLSSWPTPQDAEKFLSTFYAFDAIANELTA